MLSSYLFLCFDVNYLKYNKVIGTNISYGFEWGLKNQYDLSYSM